MNTTPNSNRHPQRGFTMTEMLVTIVVIGIIAAIAIPVIRGISGIGVSKTKRNAQITAELSGNLTALDIAHVLPESLGGAEATARLLKEGIHIDDGPMAGAYMGMPDLNDKEIEETSKYLRTVFDESGIRLEYSVEPVE